MKLLATYPCSLDRTPNVIRSRRSSLGGKTDKRGKGKRGEGRHLDVANVLGQDASATTIRESETNARNQRKLDVDDCDFRTDGVQRLVILRHRSFDRVSPATGILRFVDRNAGGFKETGENKKQLKKNVDETRRENQRDNNVLKWTNAEATHGNSKKKGRRVRWTRLKVLEVSTSR